jgi:MFS-type transporter involved in bile tolerance (Atg22 family)
MCFHVRFLKNLGQISIIIDRKNQKKSYEHSLIEVVIHSSMIILVWNMSWILVSFNVSVIAYSQIRSKVQYDVTLSQLTNYKHNYFYSQWQNQYDISQLHKDN